MLFLHDHLFQQFIYMTSKRKEKEMDNSSQKDVFETPGFNAR